MDILISMLTFAKKKREMKKISIWKKILIFFLSNFFFQNFFEIFFRFLNRPKKGFFKKFQKKIMI